MIPVPGSAARPLADTAPGASLRIVRIVGRLGLLHLGRLPAIMALTSPWGRRSV